MNFHCLIRIFRHTHCCMMDNGPLRCANEHTSYKATHLRIETTLMHYSMADDDPLICNELGSQAHAIQVQSLFVFGYVWYKL